MGLSVKALGAIRVAPVREAADHRLQYNEITARNVFGNTRLDGRSCKSGKDRVLAHTAVPVQQMTLPPKYHVRFALEEEVPTILSFIEALAEYEHLSEEVIATPEALREHLFGPKRRAEVLFSCEGDRPVGIALFFHNFSTFLARPGLYVEDIFVLPEHRVKGHGRALMVSLAKLAVERGCGRFEWTVLDWNKPSIDFYRSLGAESKPEWVIQRVSGAALHELAEREVFKTSDT
jgi:GNAT superfamily N-acetyltransferase